MSPECACRRGRRAGSSHRWTDERGAGWRLIWASATGGRDRRRPWLTDLGGQRRVRLGHFAGDNKIVKNKIFILTETTLCRESNVYFYMIYFKWLGTFTRWSTGALPARRSCDCTLPREACGRTWKRWWPVGPQTGQEALPLSFVAGSKPPLST